MTNKRSKSKRRYPASSAPRSAQKRRRVSSRGGNPLVWFAAAGALAVVLVSVSLLPGVLAKPPVPSTEAAGDLLPLADPKRPLSGGHDMNRIPAQTPAPQPVPDKTAVARLELPSASHDFGLIPKQRDVAHVFAVQNTGGADLVIDNLVTSCGCTTAELSSSIIPPGQRADLTVTFDPDFHPVDGEVLRLVWFGTNDASQPWVELRLTAVVE